MKTTLHPSAMDKPGYETLASVLARAFFQAASGKGNERHAQGQPFDEQPMQKLVDLYGVGFTLGQAAKKMQEAQRLPHVMAISELLGAINYIAGTVIAMERRYVDPNSLEAHTHVGKPANDNVPPNILDVAGGGWIRLRPGFRPEPGMVIDILFGDGSVRLKQTTDLAALENVVGYRISKYA